MKRQLGTAQERLEELERMLKVDLKMRTRKPKIVSLFSDALRPFPSFDFQFFSRRRRDKFTGFTSTATGTGSKVQNKTWG